MMVRPKLVALFAVVISALVVVPAAAAKTLRLGSRGAAVRTVQRDLTTVGIKTAVTGSFNKLTRSHVIKFQKSKRLSADGVVGPTTYNALVKAAKTAAAEATAAAENAGDTDSGGIDVGGTTTGTSTTTTTTTTTTPTGTLAAGVTPAVKLTLDKKTGLVAIPAGVPSQIAAAITAANQISHLPYVYGGGHKAGWSLSSAYDCSGSVSWVLHAAGLMTPSQGDTLSWPEDSPQMYSYGAAGPSLSGWFDLWTNDGHAYLRISNLYFDTVSQQEDGDRWSTTNVSGTSAFTERHPIGW